MKRNYRRLLVAITGEEMLKSLFMSRLTAVLVICLFSLGFVACGGRSATAPGPEAKPAVSESGQVIRTASGSTVTQTAHKYWSEGLQLFKTFEKSGWNKDNCDKVISEFDDAADEQRGFSEAEYMTGLVYQRCNDQKSALDHFHKALDANSKLCKARVAIGVDELKHGQESQAVNEFTTAIRNDPQCTEGYTNLAIVQRNKGNKSEALDNLRRALAIDAQYLPAFNEMALLYLSEAESDEKKLDLAEVVCSQAQKIGADYAPVYNTWGLIDIRRNNIISAAAKFQRAFQLDPTMFQAYMNFAQITLGFRGYEDAKNAFEEALKLMPENYDALNGVAIAYRGLEQNDKALAEYEKALKVDPNRPETYYNMGVLYQDFMNGTTEQMRMADDYYNKFLAKAGSNPAYASAMDEVKRYCKRKVIKEGKKQRKLQATDQCIAGRKQTIQETLKALQEMSSLQREAEEIEKKAGGAENQ